MIHTPQGQPQATEEGSPAACQLLRAMCRHPNGTSTAHLSTLTGLDMYTVRDVLAALSLRGRAASQLRGGVILWRTRRDHIAAMQALS